MFCGTAGTLLGISRERDSSLAEHLRFRMDFFLFFSWFLCRRSCQAAGTLLGISRERASSLADLIGKLILERFRITIKYKLIDKKLQIILNKKKIHNNKLEGGWVRSCPAAESIGGWVGFLLHYTYYIDSETDYIET